MTNKVVVDASAILALINSEKGKSVVENNLDDAVLSSVNFSEVITVTSRNGFNNKEIIGLLSSIFPNIVDFDYEQSCIASSFDKIMKKQGLSLGDRACLALAKQQNCMALTADRAWKKLDIGVDIECIR